MIPGERGLVTLLVAAGLLVLAHQSLDLVSRMAALDLSTPSGRLGLVAAIWSRAPALLSADVCLVAAALFAPGSRWLRALGLAHLVAGVGLMVLAASVLVDAGRIAGIIQGRELAAFRVSIARLLTVLAGTGLIATVAGTGMRSEARIRIGSPKNQAA